MGNGFWNNLFIAYDDGMGKAEVSCLDCVGQERVEGPLMMRQGEKKPRCGRCGKVGHYAR